MAKQQREDAREPVVTEDQGGEKLYWHGLTGKIPFQNVVVGRVTFHRFTRRVVEDDDGAGRFHLGDKVAGHVAPIGQDAVDEAMKGISEKVLVWTGRGVGSGRCHIRSLSDKRYKRNPRNEEPLGAHLYLTEVGSRDGFDRTKEPAPIAHTA